MNRFLIQIICFFSLALTALAQSVEVVPLRESGIYATGDTVGWTVTVRCPNAAASHLKRLTRPTLYYAVVLPLADLSKARPGNEAFAPGLSEGNPSSHTIIPVPNHRRPRSYYKKCLTQNRSVQTFGSAPPNLLRESVPLSESIDPHRLTLPRA